MRTRHQPGIEVIHFEMDQDSAEFYLNLLESYNRDRNPIDAGVADDANWLRQEMEWREWIPNDR